MNAETEDLFSSSQHYRPLADRLRPNSIEQFVGQTHLLAQGKPLHQAICKGHIHSMILWGPPGTGKTTLALLLAERVQAHLERLSAVTSGVRELRQVVDRARKLRATGRPTLLLVDEIHRWNKAQQDAILPHVEEGLVTLIGATTENPSFEVIPALLSRTRVYRLEPLDEEALHTLLKRALNDPERGLGRYRIQLTEEAIQALIELAHGDARSLLNALETVVELYASQVAQGTPLGREQVEAAYESRAFHDKHGDLHYDLISAFIKSVRGSDPDAALYWLARMLEGGEDPLFIARRLIILAAEDIGLADPHALTLAVSTFQAVHMIGMPEAAIPLAEATVYLAATEKSNSAYLALKKARQVARKTLKEPVPLALRNPVTRMMKSMGYGKGYRYAHDFPEHFVDMVFLPEKLANLRLYEGTDQGREKKLRARLRRLWKGKKG
ncbi:MAG: replication-associated recombination protein A [Candidatus Hydrothermae bacterium]|nr:replication-associated recombination protein A [Candidatus Hydrothermae bacterium]